MRFKICCIASAAEAQQAIHAGASMLGLVGPMPSGPGILEESAIRSIAEQVPAGITSVLLTSEGTVGGILAQHARVRTNAIQLCTPLEPAAVRELRARLDGIDLIPVVHVTDDSVIERAMALAEVSSALLLDSGQPAPSEGEPVLGGTGRTHDWTVSAAIVQAVSIPVWLAGGLNPANAREAIERVRPFGLDICSGVRSDGELDAAKLTAFAKELRCAP